MRKLVFGYSVLIALAAAVLPAQALIGIEDDVPGYDVLVPFFFVSIPGQGHDNTLIVITEVCRSHVNLKYTLFNAASASLGNGSLGATRCGVISTDALSLINQMSPAGREALAVDLDCDGIRDHYCGYMVLNNSDRNTPENQLVGMIYQVNLLAGMAAGANIPAREFDESGLIADPRLIDPTRGTEYFSANALYAAEQYIAQEAVINDADYSRWMPRYFIQDENGQTYWFIWVSEPGSSVHLNWYNEDEDVYSANISLSAELNVIDVEGYMPGGLHATYPKGGWADIALPDFIGDGFNGDRESVAYSFQMSHGPAQRAYSVLTRVHKEAGQGTPP